MNPFKRHKGLFAAACAALLVVTAMDVVLAYVLGRILDVIAAGELSLLLRTGLWALGMIAVFAVFLILSEALICALGKRCAVDLKRETYRRIFGLPLRNYVETQEEDYVNLLTQDMDTVCRDQYYNLPRMIQQAGSVVFSLAALFFIDFRLAFCFLGLSLLAVFAPQFFSGRAGKTQKEYSQANAEYLNLCENIFHGLDRIKLFGRSRLFRERIENYDQQLEEGRRKKEFAYRLVGNAGEIGQTLFQIACMFVGALFVLNGAITIGLLLTAVQLLNGVFNPITSLSQRIGQYRAARNIAEKFEAVPETEREGAELAEPIRSIEYQNVGFSPEGKKILSGFSCRMEAPKRYAVIGETGSGKSTLIRLLLQYYRGYDGKILVNGEDVQSFQEDSLYRRLVYISQEHYLFPDTLRNNMTLYGNYPEKRVEEVAEFLGFSREQLDTVYQSNDLKKLSSGEKQRIDLARALLLEPETAVFDEPASNLDPATVKLVEKAIFSLKNSLVIVITHNQENSYLEQFDEVIRIEKLQ